MEQFRKYYDDDQLKVLAENPARLGVTVRTVGHYVYQPKAKFILIASIRIPKKKTGMAPGRFRIGATVKD